MAKQDSMISSKDEALEIKEYVEKTISNDIPYFSTTDNDMPCVEKMSESCGNFYKMISLFSEKIKSGADFQCKIAMAFNNIDSIIENLTNDESELNDFNKR